MTAAGWRRLAMAGFVWATACSRPAAQPAAERFELVPFAASAARIGDLELTLEEPDVPDRPTAWEGPLRIRHVRAGGTCEAEPSLITKVFLDAAARTAIIVSGSGAHTLIDFVDTGTCRARWPRIDATTDGVRVSGDRMTILPACESNGSRARCSSAMVLKLSSGAPPVLLEAESRQVTRADVGVEFVGQAWVAAPRTAAARLVEGR